MTPFSEDPRPADVASLLDALDQATHELSESLARVSAKGFGEPSLLDGWTRAHVVAHLANVADGLVRVTGDALAQRPTSMYPGGREQRNADIEGAARVAPKQLLEHFERSAAQLATTWRDVPRDASGTVFTETELGGMQLGRLVALRLTEVEVHHADLAVAFGPRDWSSEFTNDCLPLRVAALPRLRRRADADHDVDGTWLLVCDDLDAQWWVEAHGAETEISNAGTRADAVLRGTATDLMAFLLGRQTPNMLAVAGDTTRAQAFKRAFPGP
jgi:maleylpyruvate isomerase